MLREISKSFSSQMSGDILLDYMNSNNHWAINIGHRGDFTGTDNVCKNQLADLNSTVPFCRVDYSDNTGILTLVIENIPVYLFDYKIKSNVLWSDAELISRFNMTAFLDGLFINVFKLGSFVDIFNIESETVFSGNIRMWFIASSENDVSNTIFDTPSFYLDILDTKYDNIPNIRFKTNDTFISYDLLNNMSIYDNSTVITQFFWSMTISIKLLKKNLKTTYIISPSKYNKINLGGEFYMLRNTYTSPYKRFECDIGALDPETIEKVGGIKVEFESASNISKNDYKVNSAYFHISVLNNDTLNILGFISVYFINKPYIKNMYDNYINTYVDMYHMFQNKRELNFNTRYIDKDFDYDVFRIMENKSRIYGHASVRYITCTSDTDLADNTTDIAVMYVDKNNQYTFVLTLEDPLVSYCNKIMGSWLYDNNKMDKLVYNFDINIKYYSDVFTHELKKNFKVYYLNNIKHLQNYYIN